jgi:hypothetical protein
MYITLTNANPAFRGTKIALNSELIQSIHTAPVQRDSGEIEDVTFVFCPPHGTWEVTEPLDKVVSMLNQKKSILNF